MRKGTNVRIRGKWWHYQFEVRGRLYSGNTGLEGSASNQSKAEAIAERARQRILHPQPEVVNGSTIVLETEEARVRKPFDIAAGQFSAWARDVEYRAKPNSAARLETSMASCAVFFGDRPVREVGPAEVEAYKEFRLKVHQVRDITLRHDLHALSVFFRWAMRRGYAEMNPLGRNERGERLVSIPSDCDAIREHVLSDEEEAAYLASALKLHGSYLMSRPEAKRATLRSNIYDLAVLMLEQGARPEEILALRKEHVDLEAGTIFIAGGKSRAARRVLHCTARSLEILGARMQTAGPWIFPSERRPGRHVTRLNSTHDRVCVEAGVSFVLYDLRHTWATRMIAAGTDVPTVAAIMGHSGLRTIYRYVHPTAESQKRAMERFQAAQARRKLKVV